MIPCLLKGLFNTTSNKIMNNSTINEEFSIKASGQEIESEPSIENPDIEYDTPENTLEMNDPLGMGDDVRRKELEEKQEKLLEKHQQTALTTEKRTFILGEKNSINKEFTEKNRGGWFSGNDKEQDQEIER